MKLSILSLFVSISFAQAQSGNLRLGKGVRECSPDDPCEECHGDCDTDEDCSGDLVCYQKGSAENEQEAMVPGCDGLSYSRTDYCVSVPPVPVNPIEESDSDNVNNDAPEEDDDDGVVEENVNNDAPEEDDEDGVEEDEEDDSITGFEGFQEGMTPEIAGLWLGEEKWTDAGDVYDYCSRALFQASASENKNYLSWDGVFIDPNTTGTTCEDMGIDPKTGSVNDPTYFTAPVESYLMGVTYKACLTEADCDYDVTTSEGYEDYEVIAKSCGVHLKENLLSGGFDCELYQINRVEAKDGSSTLDVAVLTYGSMWTGGFSNFTCPNKPTYDLDDLMEDPNGQGTTLMVLQSGYGSGANLTDWECIV